MRKIHCVILLLAAFDVSILLADATPSTQHATSTPAPSTQLGDLSTPKSMMLTYDALSGAGPDAFLPFFVAHNADEQRLVHAEARIDAMLAMLQVIVEKRWGSPALN